MCVINRIIQTLKAKGYTQVDLANALNKKGVTKHTISDWKSGKSKSYYMLIVDIAKFLETTTDYLLIGNEYNVANDTTNKKENEEMGVNNNVQVKRFAAIKIYEKFEALRYEVGLTIDEVREKLILENHCYGEHFEKLELHSAHNWQFTKSDKDKIESFFNYSIFKLDDFHKGEYLEKNEFQKTDLALRIEERRELKNLTQEQLANKIQVEGISVISWESGERMPNKTCLVKLNGALDLGDDMRKKYMEEFTSEIPLPKDNTGTDGKK